MSIHGAFTITAVIAFAISAPAQTNSWTKPTSGLWHEPFWSFGVLPDANQDHIMFTNAGWKALAIDRVTARDFPASLNIQRLTVGAPTNTMNTLLLNYAGLESPLRVGHDFDLGSNSFLLTLASALQVGENFFVNGTVNHSDASQVSASSLYVGNSSPGVYNFSNGLLTAGAVTVGNGTIGSFHQSGGGLSVTNILKLGQGKLGTYGATGRFELTAGTLTSPAIQVGEPSSRLGPPGSDGIFLQSSGSNFAGQLFLGRDSDMPGVREFNYTLNGGLLATSNTVVHGAYTSDYPGRSDFIQAGGVHRVEGPLAIAGFYGRSWVAYTARYTLSGGVVSARSMDIDFGSMSQSAGTNEISGDLAIGRKAAFTRQSGYGLSGGNLTTSNTFVINSEYGGFGQSGGTHAVRNLLGIAGSPRSSIPGYTLRAGALSASHIRVSTDATFSQSGGSANARGIEIGEGQYVLSGGENVVGGVSVGYGNVGAFLQNGGRLIVTNGVSLGIPDPRNSIAADGEFRLMAGTLSTKRIQIGSRIENGMKATGRFVQSGGSNSVGTLHVGTALATSFPDSTYSLSEGVLLSSNTVVNPRGSFFQSGGIHLVQGPLAVSGTLDRYSGVGAHYELSNGTVRSHSLRLGAAAGFAQYDGTNEVAGDLSIGEDMFLGSSEYRLHGGLLANANATVHGSFLDKITQTAGTHTIAGTLDLQRTITYYSGQDPVSIRYALEGGRLSVRDIRVSTNAVFRHSGGTLSHSGTLSLQGGVWQAAPGEQQLGMLDLHASSTNSSLWLTNSATTLRFAASAGTAWDLSASLLIHNWRGATNGGGSHRIIFGASETGLTGQQLAQIRFRNPAGFPAGDYTATILSTGEIIPLEPTGRRPSISYERSGGQLRIDWPSGYTLQTATNIAGPFEDVNASSSHAVDTRAGPRRFFRFRQ